MSGFRRASLAAALLGCAMAAPGAHAQASVPVGQASGALLPVKVEAETGRVLVTLPAEGKDGTLGRFLYATAIKTGFGSARIPIDRGMLGTTRILAFRRLGKKVAVLYENPRYTAAGAGDAQRGVRDSFPFSTIALLDIATSSPGTVTVDVSPFLTKDVMRLTDSFGAGAKGYKLNEALSVVDPHSVKVFPDNIELESVQTFVSDAPGKEADSIAPDGRQVSVTVHHSIIRLPPPGFNIRKFDVRAGVYSTQIYDFSAKLGEDVVVQYANHYRLEKVDPSAERSRVRKPIIFYIDSAAPEPVRTALAEGVSWWNQAFVAAGYIDALQVRILPPGADPQDIRYNVVNWSQRQTRGWSFGQGVVDPRTGEIIRGSVVLEGLRLRQDIAIFQALLGTAEENSGSANDPIRISLARLRQLGAHEVGHALGFVHNFAASTQDRASVMDYPFPRIGLAGGKLDLSDAYATGVGAWDMFSVDWLYGQPRPGLDPEREAARKLATNGAGLRFMTDIDGRDGDLPVPGNNMWTDGADGPSDLAKIMAVRKVAIANFGPRVLHAGEPLANLRRKFVPLWLFHRYEVTAVGKLLGGVHYHYAVAGDAGAEPRLVPAAEQRAALDALLDTLSPEALTVPQKLTLSLSAGISGRANPQFDTEIFDTAGGAAFDPLAATGVAAQLTLDALLAPSRLGRIYQQHDRDPTQLGLDELLDRLIAATISDRQDAVARRVAQLTVLAMAKARRDPATPIDVAAVLEGRLASLAQRFEAASGGDDTAWSRGMVALLKERGALDREIAKGARTEPTVPPGMPIGGEEGWFE